MAGLLLCEPDPPRVKAGRWTFCPLRRHSSVFGGINEHKCQPTILNNALIPKLISTFKRKFPFKMVSCLVKTNTRNQNIK